MSSYYGPRFYVNSMTFFTKKYVHVQVLIFITKVSNLSQVRNPTFIQQTNLGNFDKGLCPHLFRN